MSEHPPSLVSTGQSFVTSAIHAVMRGPDWPSTAIFVSWDDWGGFYDHVVPPVVDQNGYGLRVPGLVISPHAKKGYVDHQVLSFDAYLKFIEDDFLHGQRIDSLSDGRPDPRPTVRENASILGDLANEFDFTQRPREPLVLPVTPISTLTELTTAVTSPPNGASLSATWSLTASASDNVGITGVEFRIAGGGRAGTVIGTGTSTPSGWVAQWDTTRIPDGGYTIESVAYDTSGSVAYSAGVPIVVKNPPPIASAVTPSGG
jgi:phospholipase C